MTYAIMNERVDGAGHSQSAAEVSSVPVTDMTAGKTLAMPSSAAGITTSDSPKCAAVRRVSFDDKVPFFFLFFLTLDVRFLCER